MIAKIKGNINWWKEGFKDRGFKIRFLSAIIGFGISGILWGIECYSGTIARNEALANPFSFILGAICFGIIGSFSLMIFREKNIKNIAKFVLIGFFGWIVAFILPYLFNYFLFLFGSSILSILTLGLTQNFFIEFFTLGGVLEIGSLWLEFLFVGLIFSIFYNLILKIKFNKSILKIGIIFALVSIISPIVGNLIGVYIFSSLFLAYLITFLFIGVNFVLSIFKILEKQKTL